MDELNLYAALLLFFWGMVAGVCGAGFIYNCLINRLEDTIYEAITFNNDGNDEEE